jgi:hypothetical protein
MTEIVGINKDTSKLSPKTYFNRYLFDNIKELKRGKKKIKDNLFEIPGYDEYDRILKTNYNVSQLKKILKYYHYKISGNKEEKISRIYNNLKYSYYSIKIQKLFKGFIIRKLIKLKGEGLFNRKKCVNELDPLTLEDISKLNFENYISIQENGKTYGFNIASFWNLWKRKPYADKFIENPYTRIAINSKDWERCIKIIFISKKFCRNIIIEREIDEIISLRKRIEMRTMTVFQKIDEMGFITDVNWFLNLSRLRLGRFIKELKEIWTYRLQIPQEIKNQICPPNGHPFVGIHMVDIVHISNENLKKKCLKVMENLLSGVDHDSKHVGATYILGSLTLVSSSAANSMPWLFQSFMYDGVGVPGAGGPL